MAKNILTTLAANGLGPLALIANSYAHVVDFLGSDDAKREATRIENKRKEEEKKKQAEENLEIAADQIRDEQVKEDTATLANTLSTTSTGFSTTEEVQQGRTVIDGYESQIREIRRGDIPTDAQRIGEDQVLVVVYRYREREAGMQTDQQLDKYSAFFEKISPRLEAEMAKTDHKHFHEFIKTDEGLASFRAINKECSDSCGVSLQTVQDRSMKEIESIEALAAKNPVELGVETAEKSADKVPETVR